MSMRTWSREQRLLELVVWESLAIVALLVVVWNLWPAR